jgi:hypothetical protein
MYCQMIMIDSQIQIPASLLIVNLNLVIFRQIEIC